MTIDDFDYGKAAEFQRNMFQKREARRRALFEQAKKEFDEIITMIKRTYRPKAIYQWGSLLEEERFSEISDIDIALEGIEDPETFFRLLGDAQARSSFPLDIVQLEKIPDEYRWEILKRGRKIE